MEARIQRQTRKSVWVATHVQATNGQIEMIVKVSKATFQTEGQLFTIVENHIRTHLIGFKKFIQGKVA